MPGEFHEAQFGYYPIANSQWLREDATEASVGRVAVTKSGRKPPSPREDASEVPVGRVAVPKTGQKSPFATRGCP